MGLDANGEAQTEAIHKLTPNAEQLLSSNTRLRAHFLGKGDAVVDRSPEGFDNLVMNEMLTAGANEDDVVSALLARPGGYAAQKGEHFARTKVRAAIEERQAAAAMKERIAQRAASDRRAQKAAHRAVADQNDCVQIDSILRRTSNPVVLVLESGGKMITMSMATLISPQQFEVAFGNASLPIPHIPTAGRTYKNWINWLLARAVDEEAPPEASEELGERLAIGDRISGLARGMTAMQMQEGTPIPCDDGTDDHLMSLEPLLAKLRAEMPKLTRHMLSHHLSELGWVSKKLFIDGKQVQCWRGKLGGP